MVAGPPNEGEPVTMRTPGVIRHHKCAGAQVPGQEVADRIPDIMARHVLAGQAQVFLNVVYQLLCTQYQAITTMVVTQTGPPVHSGMHNWATHGIPDSATYSSDSGTRVLRTF